MTSPDILVIDDDHNLGNICAIVFRNANLSVEVVVDSQTALQRLNDIQPKMILLDLHMPIISGTEVLASIKSDVRFEETIIVMTTADLMLIDQLKDEADYTLAKPFKVAELHQLAQRLLPTTETP